MTPCTSSNILALLLVLHAALVVSHQIYPPTVFNLAKGPPLSAAVLAERQAAIREAFLHAWNGYSEYAWGADELLPISKKPGYSRYFQLQLDEHVDKEPTIVDGLDTALIMSLTDEYQQARAWVASINWKKTSQLSKTFETNIRYLGGLLSAYELTGDNLYLDQSISLADQVIMPAFDTPLGIPFQYVNVSTGTPVNSYGAAILAEIGTLQLELNRLTQLTGNPSYTAKGQVVIDFLAKQPSKPPGLFPISLDPVTGRWTDGSITVGGGGDSFYEYLIKNYLLTGESWSQYKDMWTVAVDSMMQYMSSTSAYHPALLWLANLKGGICFLPGNILLGGTLFNNNTVIEFATRLMHSCYQAWACTPTGIAPEGWAWIDQRQVSSTGVPLVAINKRDEMRQRKWGFYVKDPRYALRPETIESLFYFYRLTGDSKYQDAAWHLFQAINSTSRTPVGFSKIEDVTKSDGGKFIDMQESFFLAETLKYLYLIFSPPSMISLNEWVFNTEGHPFKLGRPVEIQAI
ncbi:glycoside hydrolase [Jimgerdemannia flammicorona]|uniref:alpha-1,2-Mannosidase n=1 Tax=Jimgerdemannia flammicorona TaxID=994334 RepID=A0A433Q791_9FUNG|nr:glycoside hydrolase [Jimgerdemannia flammicorona]